MKRIIFLLLVIFVSSCYTDINEIEQLKYSAKDLQPLNDSTKNLYYNDAAFIEFGEVVKDTIKRVNQVELNPNAILSYYEDLLHIYNNGFKINNSFFEYASSLHSIGASTLYQIMVAVDTNKSWASNWMNGIINTGIIEIDSIIANYNLEITLSFLSDNIYWYKIKSQTPINYLSLLDKFRKTAEFKYVEPTVLIGGGNNISLKTEGNYRYYKYSYGWGDCPSGCINYHYWVVKLKGEEITLFEEGGNTLH